MAAKKRGRKPFSVERMLRAIPDTGGVLEDIARRAGCNRKTVERMRDRHPTVAAAIEEEEKSIVDTVINRIIHRAVNEDDKTSQFYIMNNHPEAIRRGWGKRVQEVTIDWRVQLEQAGYQGDDIDKAFGNWVRDRASALRLTEGTDTHRD